MTADRDLTQYRSIDELVQHLASVTIARGLKVATAESCTGGLVAKAITDHAGASAHYVGGVVAYANDVKVRHLDVDPMALEVHGAVSKIIALQMAFGACRRFSADLGLAVTGIAGPKGGTADKPVGTVWLAVALSDGTGKARMEKFEGGRTSIRDKSVAAVLRMAITAIAQRSR